MGLDTLIRAMATVRERFPRVLLLIGGSGSLRPLLETLTISLSLSEHVRFLGFVPERDLPSYYHAADVFVLPTRELEGFGLVTVEALACGTPVLGTPVGATPEVLSGLDASLVFRGISAEIMAEDLLRFLETMARAPDAYERLRCACRAHAERYYTWERAITGLEGALGRVAARGSLPPALRPAGRPGPGPHGRPAAPRRGRRRRPPGRAGAIPPLARRQHRHRQPGVHGRGPRQSDAGRPGRRRRVAVSRRDDR